jgi:hypothetical protein
MNISIALFLAFLSLAIAQETDTLTVKNDTVVPPPSRFRRQTFNITKRQTETEPSSISTLAVDPNPIATREADDIDRDTVQPLNRSQKRQPIEVNRSNTISTLAVDPNPIATREADDIDIIIDRDTVQPLNRSQKRQPIEVNRSNTEVVNETVARRDTEVVNETVAARDIVEPVAPGLRDTEVVNETVATRDIVERPVLFARELVSNVTKREVEVDARPIVNTRDVVEPVITNVGTRDVVDPVVVTNERDTEVVTGDVEEPSYERAQSVIFRELASNVTKRESEIDVNPIVNTRDLVEPVIPKTVRTRDVAEPVETNVGTNVVNTRDTIPVPIGVRDDVAVGTRDVVDPVVVTNERDTEVVGNKETEARDGVEFDESIIPPQGNFN